MGSLLGPEAHLSTETGDIVEKYGKPPWEGERENDRTSVMMRNARAMDQISEGKVLLRGPGHYRAVDCLLGDR
jgi:hypothetical protein